MVAIFGNPFDVWQGHYMRQVIIYPDEDGYYVAECPSLPGRISQSATYEEALANIKEAIDLWSEYAESQGHIIPSNQK